MIAKMIMFFLLFGLCCANRIIPFSSKNTNMSQCENCVYGHVSINNNFTFFNQNYTKIYINLNGFVTFDQCGNRLLNCTEYISVLKINKTDLSGNVYFHK